MAKGKKHPSPFRIEMAFDEALERFAAVKPKELEAVINRSKTKKPPGEKAPRRVIAKKKRL